MKILEPVEFHNLRLKNRVVWTPAVTCLASDAGEVTDALIDRHVKRAADGVGLIQVEACGVLDRKSPKLLRLCDDAMIPGHKRMTDALHAYGAKVSVQLIHYVKQSKRTGWKQDVADLTPDQLDLVGDKIVHVPVLLRAAGIKKESIQNAAALFLILGPFVKLRSSL